MGLGCLAVTLAAVVVPAVAPAASARTSLRPADAATYSVIGQPSLSGATLGSRCPSANARFNQNAFGGNPANGDFATEGPTGIAIGSSGRLYVVDDGGHRVLSWPNADAMTSCQPADQVIGGGDGVMSGPEAITVDGTGKVYVADTLNHTVDIFVPMSSGAYPAHPTYVLGSPGKSGKAMNQLYYPRGLAVDENGRLYVADDDNNRVLIFNPPFSSGMSAADSIGAGADGGFAGPKALAISGDSLFVADYDGNRVLRFTGPFDDPSTTYASTAAFTGVSHPVDIAISPDGSLYVSAQGDGGAISPSVGVFSDAVTGRGNDIPTSTSTFGGHLTGVPLGVAVDSSGRVFLSDYEGYRVLVGSSPASPAPVDASASPATAQLLQLLQSRAGASRGRVLLGQEMPTFESGKAQWYRAFQRLHKRKLRTPAVMGAELDSLRDDKNDSAISTMIAHAHAGGVVELDWHPNDPVDNSYPGKPATADQLSQLTQPGTALYNTWHANLDGAAATLAKLQAAGVPVLFRPLVEMNGVDFFWWSDDGSTGAAHAARIQAFAAVWQDLVHYLTVTKGLHNLLFLYSPNAPDCRCAVPAMTYYPGSAYVDVVGVDVYDNDLSVGRSPDDARGLTTYQDMVATGKPFGFSEFGQGPNAADNGTGAFGHKWDARTLVERVRDSYPAMAFATAWYSSYNSKGKATYIYELSDVADVPQLMKDRLIATLPRSAP
jgi:mannan endo-1,4-beta-mannosidase